MADEATTPALKRGCELCGGVDDHPRTLHYLAPGDDRGVMPDDVLNKLIENGISGEMLKELQDPATFFVHIDCCAQSGRCPIPDGPFSRSCNTELSRAKVNGETGDAMRKKLQAVSN